MAQTITITLVKSSIFSVIAKNKKIEINPDNIDKIEECTASESGNSKIIMKRNGIITGDIHHVNETLPQLHRLINKEKSVKRKKK